MVTQVSWRAAQATVQIVKGSLLYWAQSSEESREQWAGAACEVGRIAMSDVLLVGWTVGC